MKKISHNKPFSTIVLCLLLVVSCQQKTKVANRDSEQKQELFFRTYTSDTLEENPVLLLVLHGDSPFNNPSYQYRVARLLAESNTNVVAVGVLRPGYTDEEGNTSEGTKGFTTGDNYTKEVNESIHELTKDLITEHKASKVILVGHSGGAAISANLISEYPETYQSAVLAACPCDLDVWRGHMAKFQPDFDKWKEPVNSLSPIKLVDQINEDATVMLVHGTNDKVVPLEIVKQYESELKSHQKSVELLEIVDAGHDILFDKQVFLAVEMLLTRQNPNK
ncbi:MAG: alpha/beta hydrolase [Roseivirga sp.]|nr:alpha/beta hydrolase [Roseivirga sp.]